MHEHMREISVTEARKCLGTLLDWVAQGEEVLITRRGRAVARFVPADRGIDRSKAMHAVENIRARSAGFTLRDLTIKDLVNEGRP